MIAKHNREDLLSHAMTLLDHYGSELAVMRRRLAELERGASAPPAAGALQDAECRKLLELRPLPASARFGEQLVHYEKTRMLLKSLSIEQLREFFAMLNAEQANAFEAVYVGYAAQERENAPS
jgi:hypothetical protein